jgi:hypothetical protein
MANHVNLTKKNNQRIAAAVAVSGLVGTGLAVPFAQVALAEPDPCTIISDNTEASQATLRSEIETAIADVSCEVVTINHSTEGQVLDLDVGTMPIYVGPASGPSNQDPRTAITIRSTTGLNISPSDDYSGSLLQLEDSTSWTSVSSFPFICSDSASISCSSYISSIPISGQNQFSNITLEGLTLRDAEISAIDGANFGNNAGISLHIKNSRFTSNGVAGVSNGAAVTSDAQIFVSNSVFIDNYGFDGGALWSSDHLWIDKSLFVSNEALGNGGATFSSSGTYAANSTFVDSTAREGGAIWSYSRVELALNTFDNNFASESYSSSSAYSNQFTITFWGNVFSNRPADLKPAVLTYFDFFEDTVKVDDGELDLGFNVFTVAPGEFRAPNSKEATRPELAFDELQEVEVVGLKSLGTPVRFAPVLGLTSSSSAIGFVGAEFPGQEFDNFFNDKTSVDQLGNPRTLPYSSGAHQFVAEPVVRERTTIQPPLVAPQIPKETLVPGFGANSTKLTKPMKKEIRQFLKANPDLKNVVCKGFTSSPPTPQDRALARQRGKAACDYILTLRPDAQVTIRSGSHTNKPGSQIRRVSIKLS